MADGADATAAAATGSGDGAFPCEVVHIKTTSATFAASETDARAGQKKLRRDGATDEDGFFTERRCAGFSVEAR